MHLYYLNQIVPTRRTVADTGYEEWLLTNEVASRFIFEEGTTIHLDSERFLILLEDGSDLIIEKMPLSDAFIVSE